MRAPVSIVDMICPQNDMSMYQTHQTVRSTQKPDIIILPLDSACASFQDDNGSKKGKQKGKQKANQKEDQKDDTKDGQKRKDHMVKNAKPKPKNLLWKDVLACIEFKRKTPGRTKEIKPPPSSYTVTDYVPTKPEYLPVDHLKVKVPTPGPSQTPATQPVSDIVPVQSSGLTAAQTSKGGSSSERKAADTLESTAKKFKVNTDEPDVTVQTGLYAAEMFAANLAVEYLINFIVVDDVIWTWYYDRQGTVQSSGINFIQDLPRFIVLSVLALQRVKDEDLGTVDLLFHTSHDERVTHYGLQGRATNVVVTSEALTNKYGNFEDGMVAKIFLGKASRTSELEILKKVEKIAKRHATVQDHVPELLWHHTFTNPTSAIREALGVPEPSMGSRVLYVLVFRKFYPITKLHGKDLFDVWRQCIFCHLTLWKEGVHHRDASPGNLMWYWKDGKQIGVLNDYNLSSLADDPGPRGNERTGTVPFIAVDLLTEEGQQGKVEHLHRHDLESFIWCFAWISLRYDNGVLLPQRLCPFDEWATLDTVACGEKKYVFQGRRKLPACSPTNPLMWCFLVACLKVFDAEAYNRRAQQSDSPTEVDELTDTEESASDMYNFLAKFTATQAWATLSSPSLSQ
ncbi:hypothetical protein EV424DRAFT_1643290 [Suillus variegatus]|nr:hypothetical protein EV424DRAFT_1643290 [Suillus variegatus]